MGKRKSKKVNAPSNVLVFCTREERATKDAASEALKLSAAEARGAILAPVIEFPYDRIKPRGPVFNLSYREASDGQRSLDFDGLDRRREPCEVVELRPANSARRAYDLYVRASVLDEDPATYSEAAALYEQALRFDPRLAIAECNLANLHFRRGDDRRAEGMYRHAIEVQHHLPEAHYNLGYVMLERGDAMAAITSFKTAIEQDPRFADAHFNLAMAYEQIGKRSVARNYWRMYLDLEPHGTWADIARKMKHDDKVMCGCGRGL
jgi:tetratricopeptide (TPR) repeat protein